MRRLSGWDASLLYGDTPSVHLHTLKIAVFDPCDIGGLTVDRFRQTLRRRLHLLPPLQYKLIDIPMQFHHPTWLERYPIDLGYHVRHRRVAQPRLTKSGSRCATSGKTTYVPHTHRRPCCYTV